MSFLRSLKRVQHTPRVLLALCVLAPLVSAPHAAPAQTHFDGAKALEYAREFVAIGPRWPTSPGHVKAEQFLRAHFLRDHSQLEEDTFTADTPIGPVPMRNFVVRYPGRKPGIIVLGTHYETNYPLRNIGFVGANDGASTTGLLMAIGDRLQEQTAGGKGSMATPYGWSSSMARKRSIAGRPPTPPTVAVTWPPSGAAMEPSAKSRHSCSPT